MSLFIASRISNERGVRSVGVDCCAAVGLVVAAPASSVGLRDAFLSISESRADAPGGESRVNQCLEWKCAKS